MYHIGSKTRSTALGSERPDDASERVVDDFVYETPSLGVRHKSMKACLLTQ